MPSQASEPASTPTPGASLPGVWLLAVFGGAAGTLLANAYFQVLPVDREPHRPRGTIVAVRYERVTLLDLSQGRAPVTVMLQARLLTLPSEEPARRAGIIGAVQENPFWDAQSNQFWSASTAYAGTRVVDSHITTSNGRGETIAARYSSSDESLGHPTPSPRSSVVVYRAQVDGAAHLALVEGASGSKAQRIANVDGPVSWSPDGRRLAYSCNPDGGSPTVCVLDVQRRRESAWDVPGFDLLLRPRFSPDGKRIAVSGVTGPGIVNCLLVLDAKRGTVVWAVRDVQRASSPAWSPDGRFLAYIGPQGVEVVDRDGLGRHLVLTGEFDDLQWTADTLVDFGYP